jgi:hypothetical protein
MRDRGQAQLVSGRESLELLWTGEHMGVSRTSFTAAFSHLGRTLLAAVSGPLCISPLYIKDAVSSLIKDAVSSLIKDAVSSLIKDAVSSLTKGPKPQRHKALQRLVHNPHVWFRCPRVRGREQAAGYVDRRRCR